MTVQGSTGWSFRVPPGWPVPPAGWAPSSNWRPDPSWPPAPAGWIFWAPSVQAAQAVFAMPHQRERLDAPDHLTYRPGVARRSQGARVGLLIAYFAGWMLPFIVVGLLAAVVLAFAIDPASYESYAAYETAYDNAFAVLERVVMAVALGGTLALTAALAPRAGYRRRDAAFAFVPVWGTVVMCRLLWRWTDIDHWQDRAAAPSHAWAHAPVRP